MIKDLLSILLILSVFVMHAQYEWTPAKVILKDGRTFRGLVKFPMHSGGMVSIGTTKFKYKKNRKSSTIKYGSEELDKVIFGDEQFATAEFQYVPISNNRYVLMELIVNGKAKLYARVVSLEHNSLNGVYPNQSSTTTQYHVTIPSPLNTANNNRSSTTTQYHVTIPTLLNTADNNQLLIPQPINYIDQNYQYFVLRNGEDKATCIVNPRKPDNFTYQTKQYFSDCQDILSFIESEIYDPKNLIELIEDYNLICE